MIFNYFATTKSRLFFNILCIFPVLSILSMLGCACHSGNSMNGLMPKETLVLDYGEGNAVYLAERDYLLAIFPVDRHGNIVIAAIRFDRVSKDQVLLNWNLAYLEDVENIELSTIDFLDSGGYSLVSWIDGKFGVDPSDFIIDGIPVRIEAHATGAIVLDQVYLSILPIESNDHHDVYISKYTWDSLNQIGRISMADFFIIWPQEKHVPSRGSADIE